MHATSVDGRCKLRRGKGEVRVRGCDLKAALTRSYIPVAGVDVRRLDAA